MDYNNTLTNTQDEANVCGDWRGDATDQATDIVLNRKNPTQVQEV